MFIIRLFNIILINFVVMVFKIVFWELNWDIILFKCCVLKKEDGKWIKWVNRFVCVWIFREVFKIMSIYFFIRLIVMCMSKSSEKLSISIVSRFVFVDIKIWLIIYCINSGLIIEKILIVNVRISKFISVCLMLVKWFSIWCSLICGGVWVGLKLLVGVILIVIFVKCFDIFVFDKCCVFLVGLWMMIWFCLMDFNIMKWLRF